MIYAKPGTTFATTLAGATGLTPGIRIENVDGTNHTPRTTEGIVEVEPDSGIYAVELTAPDERGGYVVLWDDGASVFAAEDLAVVSSLPDAAAGAGWPDVDDLARYLSPRAPQDLSVDLLAALALEAAIGTIRLRTDQTIDLVELDTATFSGTGDRALILPQLPVVAVDEVRVDGEIVIDWILLESGILRLTAAADWNGWPCGDGNIEVDYSHGHDPIPAELRLLAVTLAARAYQQGLARQESTGGASVTYSVAGSLDLTSGERTLLGRYRPHKATTVAASGA